MARTREEMLQGIFKSHNDGRECMCPYCTAMSGGLPYGPYEQKDPVEQEYERRQEYATLLKTWLDTQFFATKAEWEKWVKVFRPRVELALAGKASPVSKDR